MEIFAPSGDEGTNTSRSIPFVFNPEYEIGLSRGKSLEDEFDQKKIDLVHIHTPFSLGAAALRASRNRELPAVGTFHTLLSEYIHYVSESIPDFIKDLLIKGTWKYVTEFYKKFEIVTAPSTPIKERLMEKGIKNIFVLPNAVDADHYHPADDEEKKDSFVLFVGRIGKEKKLEVLIEAAPKILEEFPELDFEIIGKGLHKNWYQNLVKERGLEDKFNFRGYVAEEELVKSYQNCDVFVIPSDTETQGLVALEAMACGSPVVGARAGGLKYTISHGSDGFLFSPGSTSELSKYVIKLLKNEEMRTEMGRKAREKAEKFSAERIGDRWIDFYSKILE